MSQDPNWISIPIAKFSHNTNPVNVQKFTWIHVSHRNDLDFVMQSVRILDGLHHRISTVMKVTAGAELLVRPTTYFSRSILLVQLSLTQI